MRKIYVILAVAVLLAVLAAGCENEKKTNGDGNGSGADPVPTIYYEWNDMLQGDDGHDVICWANGSHDPDGDIVKIRWNTDDTVNAPREFTDMNDTLIASSYKDSAYHYRATSFESKNPVIAITLTVWDDDGNEAAKTITVHNPF